MPGRRHPLFTCYAVLHSVYVRIKLKRKLTNPEFSRPVAEAAADARKSAPPEFRMATSLCCHLCLHFIQPSKTPSRTLVLAFLASQYKHLLFSLVPNTLILRPQIKRGRRSYAGQQ